MNNKQNNLAVIALAVVAVLALIATVIVGLSKVGNEYAGAFAAPGHNQFVTVTQTATTTATNLLPVQVFATNTSRIYGLVVNDSDTDIYIFLKGFSNSLTAAGLVDFNKGIRLNANGGNYEILPENMYLGPIWASSTATGKRLLTIEK